MYYYTIYKCDICHITYRTQYDNLKSDRLRSGFMYKVSSGFIGILITVMIFFNGVLSNTAGNYLAIVIIHLVGLLCLSLVLIINKIKLKRQEGIPLFLYSAGAIGVFTVLFNNISFNCLGASLTLAFGLLGQSIASIGIDHFGLFGTKVIKFKKEKFIGLALISLGIVIMTIY